MSGLVGRGIPRSDFFWIAAITDERTERRKSRGDGRRRMRSKEKPGIRAPFSLSPWRS